MQLHRLRLAAIGPFAGEHEIDFAALGAGGLFLLEGPTGAGKSTLIDAIVYALYGQVAGTTSKDRIRSGFAEPGTESYVDLVFETNAGLFRVRRSPEWSRPKKRGDGVTKVQAAASLWRLASVEDLDGGEHMSGRLDEVGAEIERAIGLNRAQFVQTIVLPQGEFATFLKAKPEDRRLVLQRVFGTESYERVQQELVSARKLAVAQIEGAQRQVEDAVTRLCAVLGPFEDESVTEALVASARGELAEGPGLAEGLGLAELAAAQVALAERAAAEAHGRAEAATAQVTTARALAVRSRARREAVERWTALHARRASLLEAEDEQARRVDRLAAARRAVAVAGALTGLTRAEEAVGEATRALTELDVTAELRALDRAGLVSARDEAQRAAGGLVEALTLAAAHAEREGERASQRTAVGRLETALDEVSTELAGRPAVRAALAERLAELRPLADTAGVAGLELERATERLTAARSVARIQDELVEAQSEITRCAEDAAKRVDEESRVRKARIAGIAGELARGLADGEPCPVCGASEHPHPAALGDEHVDEEQVAAAEEDRREADAALHAARGALAGVQARLAVAQVGSGGLDAEAAQAAHAAALAALERAQAAVTERDAVQEEIEAAEAHDKHLTERQAGLARDLAEARAAITALTQRITEDAARLEAARGEFESVEARRAHLDARCEDAEALLAATDRLAEVRDQLERRTEELAAALTEHDFPDADAARAASLPAHETDALERAVEQHRDELARVTAALAAPELAEALREDDGPEVDPAALDPASVDTEALDETVAAASRALEEAETLAREVSADASVHARRATEGTRCLDELTALLGSTAAAREAAAPVIRMAELAQGAGPDNPRRLTLATYVLLRRFEEVVDVANERLAVMSDGRYALERSEARESGGGLRQGLALRVRDNTIDTDRDPHTLSGGETFYVSLCLALALAQVVTAEAGGVDLGTLFVDEGFGTLDPHVLEAVLSQLGTLHAEGRTVGIISHVAELKDAIAERIEVRKTAQGPSTLRVVA